MEAHPDLKGRVKRTPGRPYIVGLACGTCDLGISLGLLADSRLILGIDLSGLMFSEAKARATRVPGRSVFAACDILAPPLADPTVDVVTLGYGLRNTGDANLALAEVAHMLKPGGCTREPRFPSTGWSSLARNFFVAHVERR